jgi:hypothetical protein
LTSSVDTNHTKSALSALTIAALGIVYGDIGTSPLYTMKTIFSTDYGLELNAANLLGVISLIVWGLTIVVTVKYVTLILRADNQGEGGIMALLSLALSSIGRGSRWYVPLMVTGLFGAALFFGDGVITPAISVLSAIEGLDIATPAFHPYVVPLTCAVLFILYMVQRHGSSGIGRWFGPIMFLWFAMLAFAGVVNIAQRPEVLAALNPWYAISFMLRNRGIGFVALGAIVLAFTGAEALYADLGHFGRKPIRIAWCFIVFPALAANYLGQGAILLNDPSAVSNPFFHQLGAWSIYPLVILSTVATVIASQATISGTYSMTREAIALGFMPRMLVIHTSARQLAAVFRRDGCGDRLRFFRCTGIGLRHRGDCDDGDHHHADLLRHSLRLETQSAIVLVRHDVLRVDRFDVLRVECLEDRQRRLVPAGIGLHRLPHHADLEARTQPDYGKFAIAGDSAGRIPAKPVCRAANTCTRHGCFPTQRKRWRAACDAAQSRA